MICVRLRQAGNVHFTECGGSVGSNSVAATTRRRKELERCVAQFNRENANTPVRIGPAFTLEESAFEISVISEAGRETDLAIFVGWISRVFPEVIAEWSIIDKALDGGNDVLRIGSDALEDVHKETAAKPQAGPYSMGDEKATSSPSVAPVLPASAVEDERGLCALGLQEDQSALDETGHTDSDNTEAQGLPSNTEGSPPTHTDAGGNSARTRCEDGAAALDDLFDPQDCPDFSGEAVPQITDDIPLPEPLVLTALEMERRPAIEMVVDRSECAVIFQVKDEAVVIILESRGDKDKLLNDPSAGAFEECGRANLIRAIDETSGDDECR